jgi:hypothetical protein|tara:strand:+ start:78 stop:473 length:396 start_codon:yes stop_codon:yes gene_type:complete
MESKKAQAGVEFIMIVSTLFFFMSLFFLTIQENMADETKKRENLLAREIALIVQDEINLALESRDGYERNFEIPKKVGNLDYEITVSEGVVYIITGGNEHALALQVANVSGEINITKNNIKKIDGKIYLNE